MQKVDLLAICRGLLLCLLKHFLAAWVHDWLIITYWLAPSIARVLSPAEKSETSELKTRALMKGAILPLMLRPKKKGLATSREICSTGEICGQVHVQIVPGIGLPQPRRPSNC